jgi:hypothetical protein
LPFQSVAGIQTSMRMSESLEGVSVAAMRQDARGASSDPEEPSSAGAVSARVIVAFGRTSDRRPVHAAGGRLVEMDWLVALGAGSRAAVGASSTASAIATAA